MKRDILKVAVNTVLSIILTLAVMLSIVAATVVDFVIESDIVFEKLEQNGAYEDKIAQIAEEIKVLVVNSGVDGEFIERILPPDDLVINAYNVSVGKLLGRNPAPVSTDEYKNAVISAFSEKALDHGITEKEDINEIAGVYWQDISEIFVRVTGFIGAGTIGAYVPSVVSAVETALLPVVILAVAVYLFMIILNRRSGTFYSVIPFISQSAFFGAAYLIFKSFVAKRNFDTVQLGLLSSADAYLFYVLKISLALLLGALLVFAINTTINLIIRGKRIGKEQKI